MIGGIHSDFFSCNKQLGKEKVGSENRIEMSEFKKLGPAYECISYNFVCVLWGEGKMSP